jgi:hypothetical protein
MPNQPDVMLNRRPRKTHRLAAVSDCVWWASPAAATNARLRQILITGQLKSLRSWRNRNG